MSTKTPPRSEAMTQLVDGYKSFRDKYFEADRLLYGKLAMGGQKPKVAVIACSDSRVDPAIVLQAKPGELFAIRNVANLVPPFEDNGTYHGTSAALEFAVCTLGVSEIVVIGHAHCAGIKTLMETDEASAENSFVGSWTSMVSAAKRRVRATLPNATKDQQNRACEQSAVMVSLENLMTFPWIAERVENGKLALHGWYIDITTGELSAYHAQTSKFEPIS